MKNIDLKSAFSEIDNNEKFKRYRSLWERAGKYDILTDYPLHLDIELSGICNLNCSFCFQNGLIQQPLGLMEMDLFKNIIDDGVEHGLCAIKLQIRGESFLHPKLFECIAYAKNKGVLDVQITTNGTLLKNSKLHELLNSGLDAIIFSIDSHHGNSYSQRNNTKNYSTVEQTIKELLKLRTRLGKERPWIRLQASIPQTDPDSFEQTRKYLIDKFPEADIVVVSRIYNYRNDIDAFPDLHTNYELHPCNYLMHRLSIFWNGIVTICCVDYNSQYQLGNIAFKSIQEMWLSAEMKKLRILHKENKRKIISLCKHCGACVSLKNNHNILDKTMCHIADYE